MSASDGEVLRFIRASFPSVWALELILALKRDRRMWTREQLITTLRASELVVSRALDALVAAGLASVETCGVIYMPANLEIEDYIERVEHLYCRRPNAVRRTIISSRKTSASVFADAFKLRREADD